MRERERVKWLRRTGTESILFVKIDVCEMELPVLLRFSINIVTRNVLLASGQRQNNVFSSGKNLNRQQNELRM